ncbi:hypothetical protein JOM56_002512 [Amanita muscaria]
MQDESPPSLLMSQLIAADAPLLSPMPTADSSWDSSTPLYNDSLNYKNYFYPSPPSSSVSPPPASSMLKSRMTPDSFSEQELCLPTHQVFSLTQTAQFQRPPSPAQSNSDQSHDPSSNEDRPSSPALSEASSCEASGAVKRPGDLPTIVTKKPRSGERISVKDFVPPDVTGLSKREARLVKNRAAAFLSRQRKREEFENMEVRVARLEQENAKLLALTQGADSYSHPKQPEGELVSEINQLRAQLAVAKDRERELSAELASQTAASSIKVESTDAQSSIFSSRASPSVSSPHRSGASLGLMVLLCALPSLLSMPVQSTAAANFSIPDSLPTSSFDYSSYLPNDYDWSRPNSQALMDTDDSMRLSTASAPTSNPITRKLHFTDVDIPALAELGGLDISFDTSPSDNGKIRVRIHPSSSAEATPNSDMSSESDSAQLDMWSRYPSNAFLPASKVDPFFGIGMPSDYGILSPISSPTSSRFDQPSTTMQLADSTFDYETHFTSTESPASNTRRVRIALKSLPAAGGEGGEWEVQIC